MFSFFKVKGRSMEPFLKEDNFVFVNKFVSLKKGDAVAIKHPTSSRILLKRVIKERYQEYWIEGDNKEYSSDSRIFGWVSKSNILGRVKVIHK